MYAINILEQAKETQKNLIIIRNNYYYALKYIYRNELQTYLCKDIVEQILIKYIL